MIFVKNLNFNYRYEIQPLRVLSIFLVAVYHIWFYGISGGVDVFLCLSGYFFFIHYLKGYSEGLNYHILDHVRSIVVRLLPTTLLFLFCLLLLSKILFNLKMQGVLANDLFGAFTYSLNFNFIHNSYNYVNRTSSISPLVHLWAVNVIGQLSIFSTVVLFIADKTKTRSTHYSSRFCLYLLFLYFIQYILVM